MSTVTTMNIRARREALGLTLEHVAQRLTVDKSYLSRIETGQRPATDDQAFGISMVVGGSRVGGVGTLSGANLSIQYANPGAFAVPAAGRWGSAGRNSIRGPAQFSLNAGIGRSFLMTERLTLDWRIDATNILNRVTYSTISTILGSPQFGLPVQANVMRKLQSTLRVRF